MKIAVPVLAAVLLALGASSAQAGSGSVKFEFLNFRGSYGIVNSSFSGGDPTDNTTWFYSSEFNGQDSAGTYGNGQAIFSTYATAASGQPNQELYGLGTRVFTLDAAGNPTQGPSSVSFSEAYQATSFGSPNLLSFTSNGFSDVGVGQPFTLGTLTFTNGAWYGSGASFEQNSNSLFGFRITTESTDGAAFNQTAYGILRLVVNSPANNDPTTFEGQQAEADWISVYGYNSAAEWGAAMIDLSANPASLSAGIGSFRVYDSFAIPAGFSTTGTVDVTGMFNSLDLLGLANPRNGFITAGAGPLPGTGGGGAVPEPGVWALLISGFGAVGASLRRRRLGLPGAAA